MITRKLLFIFSTGCLVLACLAAVTFAQKTLKREKVVAVKTIKGRTIGFEMGDYQHANILTLGGRMKSFFIFKPGLDYFLALHKGSVSTFTYEVADVNIPESGGIMRVDRLTSAKVGDLTFETWWKKVSAKYSLEQLDDKYGPLVRKYQAK